uniref:Uncharacterized protein n=1 Tax=Oryza glumipatula TaxID=40148 RepID=A0A0E0A6U8_9ORYZ
MDKLSCFVWLTDRARKAR